MTKGILGLLGSKKALIVLALMATATIFVLLDRMTSSDWATYTKWLFVAFAGAHTVSDASSMFANRSTTTTKIDVKAEADNA